jgi:uncharacterized membrane protein YphA (DoxX/SURF4 family)
MATTQTFASTDHLPDSAAGLTVSPSRQAFQILRFAYTVAPIAAGLDKFFNLLVDWDQYLPSMVTRLLGGNVHTFMQGVGVVEIVAGIGVALRPRLFSYVVAGWLAGIILNLLAIPGYYDIALRDLGLALGALALARLSAEYSER